MTTITNTVAKAFDRATSSKAHGDKTARTAAFIAILNADMIDRNSGITEPNEETAGSNVARLVMGGA